MTAKHKQSSNDSKQTPLQKLNRAMDVSSRSMLSRSVFILPSLLTLASMFAGFYAIIASMHAQYEYCAIAIFIAMIFDALDGRIARLTQTQTEFGAQLDSIADMVSFGIAPAVLLYVYSLFVLGKVGWLLSFFYAACTALRLAKFNITPSDKSYFFGLATPASAGVVAAFVWVSQQEIFVGEWLLLTFAIGSVCLGLLKVSSIPYRSFKDIDLRAKVSLLVILCMIVVFVLVWADPSHVLLGFFTLYALSGPVLWLWCKLFRKKKSSHKK